MTKLYLLFGVAACLASCLGAANYKDNPNSIQRAEILSKNELGITVEHSDWGEKIAFRFADEHSNSIGKVAVYTS